MTDWFAFGRMRGDDQPRTWMRWSEFRDAVMTEMPFLGDWDIRQVIRQAKPEKRYGHYRYTNEHIEAVRAYSVRKGFTKEMTHV